MNDVPIGILSEGSDPPSGSILLHFSQNVLTFSERRTLSKCKLNESSIEVSREKTVVIRNLLSR